MAGGGTARRKEKDAENGRDETNRRFSEALDRWKESVERKYCPGSNDSFEDLTDVMAGWVSDFDLDEELGKRVVEEAEEDDDFVPDVKGDKMFAMEQSSVTGNETLADLCRMVVGRNVFMVQELACDLSFPNLFDSVVKPQLSRMAMQLAKESLVMVLGMFCEKSAVAMAPILSSYLSRSFFNRPTASLGDPLLDGQLNDLIVACLGMLPKVTFGRGQGAANALRSVADKSLQFSSSFAEQLARSGRPLSETLPVLRDMGWNVNNKLVFAIVRAASYIIYRMVNSDSNKQSRDRLCLEILAQVAKMGFDQ